MSSVVEVFGSRYSDEPVNKSGCAFIHQQGSEFSGNLSAICKQEAV